MSFHMTLPSDGSLDVYPQNTLSDYRTHLPQMMNLEDDDWEVGLSEIVYPTSIMNVQEKCNTFWVLVPAYYTDRQYNVPVDSPTDRYKIEPAFNSTRPMSAIRYAKRPKDALGSLTDPQCQIYRVEIHPGFYRTAQALVEELNHALHEGFGAIFRGRDVPVSKKEEVNQISFVYSPTYNKVQLEFTGPTIGDKHLYGIRLCGQLSHVLGFHREVPQSYNEVWFQETKMGKVAADVYMGMSALYVSSDVVEPQIVGSQNLQLLRIVPFQEQQHRKSNTHARLEPNRVDYLPIAKKHFDTLSMHIRNDMGEKVPFLLGKVIVKLHFRRKSIA